MKRINFRSGLFQAVLLMLFPFLLMAQAENNARIVYDACDNSLKMFGPNDSQRKSFFIRQNEVLSFEIHHPNTLKYEFSLNHSLESYNVDFKTIANEFPSGQGRSGFMPTYESCKDKIDAFLSIQSELNFEKKKLEGAECIDNEDIMQLMSLTWLKFGAEFAGVSFDTLISDMQVYFSEKDCEQNKDIENYLIYSKDSLVIGFTDSFKLKIEQFQNDFMDIYTLYHTPKIYSLPVYTNGQNIDIVRYTLKKDPLNKKFQFGKATEIDYDIEVRRGFKIDVSAGLFLTGLVDEKYKLADKGDSLKTIVDEKTDQYSISIGSTVNMNWRLGCSMYGGFSLGVAMPFTNESKIPQIMVGLDYIVGREWRLGIVGGVVYGPTSVLKQGYDSGSSYAITDNTVPMTEISKVSYFFGLVYNLGSEKILGKNE